MITKDGAPARGLRTALYTIGGLFVGLMTTVWAVPGVPEAVAEYALHNFIPVSLSVGIPSGIISYLVNRFMRKSVSNV